MCTVETTELWQMLPILAHLGVQFTEITHAVIVFCLFVCLFFVKYHLGGGVTFLTFIKLSQQLLTKVTLTEDVSIIVSKIFIQLSSQKA